MASTNSATDKSIWIGFDPRPEEVEGFGVAQHSIRKRLSEDVPIYALRLSALRAAELYHRPTEMRDGRLWDVISGAPMSTEFAISRFLVPFLAQTGWALFVDADVMARVDLLELFNLGDPSKACMCVKHNYTPRTETKMMGQAQTAYPRKNWSSVVLWNCNHPKTKYLTPNVINTERGLWLHQFAWLHDEDIGSLDPAWNHLVGDNRPNTDAKLVHFTNGTPNMTGCGDCEFAAEWWVEHEAISRRA